MLLNLTSIRLILSGSMVEALMAVRLQTELNTRLTLKEQSTKMVLNVKNGVMQSCLTIEETGTLS